MHTHRSVALGLLLPIFSLWATAQEASVDRPWLNPHLPTERRLQVLLAQLNATQKFAMLQGDTELDDNGTGVSACIGHISGNDTLGIPSICMGDGPAGVGNSLDNVTTFPAPVVTASSWNPSLAYAYGQALAQEHMAKGHNVVLAPTINILRSPLWARAAETYSEDPWLASRLAVENTLGIQSQGALACPKHFAAYNQDTNRFGLDPDWDTVDVHVDKRTLHEVYFPAFKAAVQEANAASIMCSYNKLNGFFACENDWLLNTTLKQGWGFSGFVVADWYFSTRSTVGSVMSGLDVSMPGGSLVAEYGFPDYYGDLLIEAVDNGTVPFSRIDDMVRRIWRYMFELGAVDDPITGNSTAVARTQVHLDLAQEMAEEGAVLLKNDNRLLPLSQAKYKKIAVFGVDGTNQSQVTENHGGFVIDSTMIVQSPLDALKKRGTQENITVAYSEAYPGTNQFATVPSSMFGGSGINVTYYTTTDFSGPVNQSVITPNITAATYPEELWTSWPDIFSCVYTGTFLSNTSGVHYFSLTGQGDATLYLDGTLVGNMSKANFGNTVQGIANLAAGSEVSLTLNYSMGYSLSTGAYGVTLGMDVSAISEDAEANALAEEAGLSIIFVSDRLSEGLDNNLGLSLPGNQDAIISRLAKRSKSTLVVLQTNSAVLMPWLSDVDAVLEAWYAGQQIGLALERLLFGDISPSGKLPLTFPATLDDAIQITSDLHVNFTENLYVGYKYYDKNNIQPLFPFGHGLTYSDFSLSEISLRASSSASTSFQIASSIICTSVLYNNGAVDAKEVVQLYVSYPAAANEPPKLLKAFKKVELKAGQRMEIVLSVEKDYLNVWDEVIEDWKFINGEYIFFLGFSAADLRLEAKIKL